MSDEKNEFTIEYKKGALVKSLLWSIVFAAGITWFFFSYKDNPNKSVKGLLGLAASPVAAFGCLLIGYGAARNLLGKRPAFAVSEDGITCNHSIGDTTRFPWSQISGFETREQTTRNHTLLFIDVLGNTPVRKPLTSISADDLADTPANVLHRLQEYAASRKEESTDSSVAQTPVAQPFRLTYRVGASAGLIAFTLLGIGVVSAPFFEQYGYIANGTTKDWETAGSMLQVDKALSAGAMTQAIKKTEPEQYAQYRKSIVDGISQGKSQEELETMVSDMNADYMQHRMQHASMATLRQYAAIRLKYQERIAKHSTDALYSTLVSGKYDPTAMPESVKADLESEYEKMSDEIARVIVAPSSATPIPQDTTLANQRLQELYTKLSDAEVAALRGEGETAEARATYCDAYFHFHREAMKLPDEELVQVLREIEELPKDDRADSPEKS